MTSTSQVIVELFHINVGLGDSAIHVVCIETCTETENGSEITRVFDRAVFIDGGKGSDGAVQSIVDTIEQLEERFSMDIWFVTVNIAVEVAARLAIMGPPLHGIVHVDFWVFGFDVAFGDFSGGDGVAALQLAAFWDLATQAESRSSEETGKAVAKPAHMFACTKGLLTAKNKQEAKASDPWLVQSGLFQFTVECQFAIQTATVNGEGAKAPDPSRTTIDAIYARPMHLTQTVESTLEVDIGIPGVGRAKGWKATLAWEDMPEALWGKRESLVPCFVVASCLDLHFFSLFSSFFFGVHEHRKTNTARVN